MIQEETYLETHSIRLTKHDLSFRHPQIYQEIFDRFPVVAIICKSCEKNIEKNIKEGHFWLEGELISCRFSKLEWVSTYIPWTNYIFRHQSKMSSSKKLTCKGTLRQVFIIAYIPEIQPVMLVNSTQFCELLPLSLLSGSTLQPPPVPVCISKLYSTVRMLS